MNFFHMCLDINECDSFNGHCLHTCHDTKSGYYCSCDAGYELADDKRSCQGERLETSIQVHT